MSSKREELRKRDSPYRYVQKFNLSNNNKRIKRRNLVCLDCKETNDCISLFSNKVNKIEEIVNDFHKNIPKKKTEFSIFNAKFTLNNVPCELEYDLSKFTLENLQKLVIFTTQNCNNNNINKNNASNKNDN
ncbi:hypothetical protein C1645_817006 [Glomus cerebriforme]|uniref:Uncharacterized protein n=1 Tax=Glomus cerebriforme TaxID=658196 RepID=A0A397TAA2_9GLOM|nr:hypothetical protein C1645_817006 [Glomus cerebriforme]